MVKSGRTIKYPGIRAAMDGNTAVIMCEREASDAAGAYPITPSTQMGEYWAEETANGHINVSGRPLIFIEPEGEHAAAGVTAGMAMTGLRAANFSSGQGIAYMHESLYAAAGKRLPYLLNIGCRAITKASLNVHAGHDDYHAIDDTGFFQVMGKSAQEIADLNLIARKIAELSLTPGAVGQDGFLTTHLIESLSIPERELIAEYLGRPDDVIETPTPAQRLLYGDKRRRIPAIWDVDNPVSSGCVQNQDAYMQAVAAQRPFFYDHIAGIADQCMAEFGELTGRRYSRVATYRVEDADYLILGMGSMLMMAEAVADYLRETRKIKVGVVNVTMFRPFPGDLIGHIVQGRKGVTVLERTDQPLAEDLPLAREVRAAVAKCVENGAAAKKEPRPHPRYAVYARPQQDVSPLYSGAFGLGSRDLQPEGIIGAVENMLAEGKKKKFYYLSIDFARKEPFTPKQEIHQDRILELYPEVRDLSIRGSENPNLMPPGAVTVRIHSVGGWGAITTGKNLAMTLFELLDYDIKANPKYGSEKKGQPTTYYLSAAPEPIRVNCEYHYVDVVLSPDPNVFAHSNAVSGLKKGGVFIIQSELESPTDVWRTFPAYVRKFIVNNGIRVYYLDAFKIAREEATDVELQFRMQGIAFQGAFFAASPVMHHAKLNEEQLFQAIREQLQSKFGSKGARVVEDNLRTVRRGFDEVKEITAKAVDQPAEAPPMRKQPNLPVMLKTRAAGDDPKSDIHRFWEQTGSFYITGAGNDNLADPFNALGLMPASTGIYRDMTQIRFEHPLWIPEKCTACSDCFTVCPDSAIPGLVNSVAEVFETAVRRVERGGHAVKHLRVALRTVDKKLRQAAAGLDAESIDVAPLLRSAISDSLEESALPAPDKQLLEQELGWFQEELGNFKFALTKPYYGLKEKRAKGSGGLFSITISPYTCKGCMECVRVCEYGALEAVQQTAESVETLRRDWDFWLSLPTTSPDYIRIDDLDDKAGALETMLLDKRVYASMNCGDGACNGCGEKTALHLFTATIAALMQPRVAKHVADLTDLIERLEERIRLKLAGTLDLGNVEAVETAVQQHRELDLTLSRLSALLDRGGTPLDRAWLQWVIRLLDKLKHLRWQYTEGVNKNGRAALGFINATGCTSVYGSTFPYNPYPFPWSSHLFQDAPSVAMGVFEGHMAKMAEGFKAVRMARLELEGKGDHEAIQEQLRHLAWRDFSDEEFRLCPPVVAVGGDGAMYDIGFQNVSRALMSGMPIKIFVVDTQVYSNTGGQACTSGFISQVSDMAPYGPAWKGKTETRKEMALIAMAHRTCYVVNGSISNYTHLIEAFIDGLNTRRPALFNIYSVCQPEHGVGDDASDVQSKMAVESRAYPLMRFDPDAGATWEECLDLVGNPAPDDDWPVYELAYEDEDGNPASIECPMTFADFALTEGRFRKHFRTAPPDTWNEDMIPIAEYLDLGQDEREGRYPYVWAVDSKHRLARVMCSAELTSATEERRHHWRLIKSLAGQSAKVDLDQIARQARVNLMRDLSARLLSLVGGDGDENLAAALSANPAAADGAAARSQLADYEAVWIETAECTACDECITINPRMFAYNGSKQATIVDSKAGSFKDVVRSAEKCPARCIHPGTPWDPNEKGLDKLMKRAAKYQ